MLRAFRALSPEQIRYIEYCKSADVGWADATSRLPLADRSADVIYTSHMLEHLDRDEVALFLSEVMRVLKPSGKLRVAVPDLRKHIEQYVRTGDANAFVEATLLTSQRPRGMRQRIRAALVAPRNHRWMYDGNSLSKRLEAHGFSDVVVLPAGRTTIPSPGELNLREREEDSVYVEATKPE